AIRLAVAAAARGGAAVREAAAELAARASRGGSGGFAGAAGALGGRRDRGVRGLGRRPTSGLGRPRGRAAHHLRAGDGGSPGRSPGLAGQSDRGAGGRARRLRGRGLSALGSASRVERPRWARIPGSAGAVATGAAAVEAV